MKFISWNVNGLRSCMTKGFKEVFDNFDADAFCIQETKLQQNQIDENIKALRSYQYFNDAIKKGYSGTACFVKDKPLNIYRGINVCIPDNLEEIDYDYKEDSEGRIITLEYDKFFLVNCYVPNSKRELERLDFRAIWENNMRKYLVELDKVKPVIYCGDLNVAHEEIDLKNPKQNVGEPGFSNEERSMMSKLLSSGFSDVYRKLYPDGHDYTWWSYRANARENDTGWRIDYFIVSDRFLKNIKSIKIHKEIYGSDHCPVELEIK